MSSSYTAWEPFTVGLRRHIDVSQKTSSRSAWASTVEMRTHNVSCELLQSVDTPQHRSIASGHDPLVRLYEMQVARASAVEKKKKKKKFVGRSKKT